MGLPLAVSTSPSQQVLETAKHLQSQLLTLNYRENPDLLAFAHSLNRLIRSRWAVNVTHVPARKRKRGDDGSNYEEADEVDDDSDLSAEEDESGLEHGEGDEDVGMSQFGTPYYMASANWNLSNAQRHRQTTGWWVPPQRLIFTRSRNNANNSSSRVRRRYGVADFQLSAHAEQALAAAGAADHNTVEATLQHFDDLAPPADEDSIPMQDAAADPAVNPPAALSVNTQTQQQDQDQEMQEAIRLHWESPITPQPPSSSSSSLNLLASTIASNSQSANNSQTNLNDESLPTPQDSHPSSVSSSFPSLRSSGSTTRTASPLRPPPAIATSLNGLHQRLHHLRSSIASFERNAPDFEGRSTSDIFSPVATNGGRPFQDPNGNIVLSPTVETSTRTSFRVPHASLFGFPAEAGYFDGVDQDSSSGTSETDEEDVVVASGVWNGLPQFYAHSHPSNRQEDEEAYVEPGPVSFSGTWVPPS
ncbi:hypothetical protein HDV05_004960 [Chytridiales sp. JEL 0842]|nr:hypothetical protein HDV05_004960 [Chytridiales sp. JEL 0842]